MNVEIDAAICSRCKLNTVAGLNKVFDDVYGRPILIVSQSPSFEENNEAKLLVDTSPVGKFIWNALARVGIDSEQCDVTSALRCMPSDPVPGSISNMLKARAPGKEETKLCQSYTKEIVQIALKGDPKNEGTTGARAILILGQTAAKQLLGGDYRKNKRIIDSAKLGVRVFCVDHPGFFLRGGARGLNEKDERLMAFRQTLRAMADYIGTGGTVETSDVFLAKQDYRIACTKAEAWDYARKLKRWAITQNQRLSVDVEDDVPDDLAETGTEVGDPVILTCAVSPKAGFSVMFVVDHPEAIRKERDGIVAALKWLLSDPDVRLTMHYGSTDAEKLLELLNIPTPGYDLDTFTGMYLMAVGRPKYGIEALVDEFAPQFSGYKWMIAPYVGPAHVEVPNAVKKSNEALYNFYKNKSLVTCPVCGIEQFVNPDNSKSKSKRQCRNKECQTEFDGTGFESAMHFKNIPLSVLRLYNNADADVGKRFEQMISPQIDPHLTKLYTDMGHLVMRMERNGPLVDDRHLQALKRIWPKLVKAKADELKALAAEGTDGDIAFNPNNAAHIAWLLWTKLDIPYPDPKSKTWKTEKEILLQALNSSPVPGKVIAYRKVAKTMSTYITGYDKCAHLNAGHLRTKWWLCGTKTGRLSSGGSKEKIKGVVNLQNIQKHRQIRNIIISDNRWRELHLFVEKRVKAGWSDREIEDAVLELYGEMDVNLEFDQGQVEVRLAAQLSGDKNMIADCEAGDIHSQVGHTMTGWEIQKIRDDPATRTRTKNVHFGILFGLKPPGILKYIRGFDPTTTLTVEDIEGYYRAYFARYPGMQVYIDMQHVKAERDNYVETIFGMKRPIIVNEQTEGLFDDYGQPAYWKNIAVNTPIQGSAHQLLMCGMVQLIRNPEKYGMLGIPQMEVHDNLVMKVKLKNLVHSYFLMKELLEQEPLRTVEREFPHIKWRVKLEVDGAARFRFGVKTGLGQDLDEQGRKKAADMSGPAPIGAFCRMWYTANCQSISELRELKAA